MNFRKLKERAKKEIQGKLDQAIDEFKVQVLDTSIADVKEVLDDYFNTNPPFKEGLKKNEFPDALSLNAIKKWCEEMNESVIHLSYDKDFEGFKNAHIDCSQTLSSLLELLYTENTDIQHEIITSIYEKSIGIIEGSVEEEVLYDLSSLVYSEIENDPWYENVEIDFYGIEKIEDVIGVINEIEDDRFSYEIEMNIYFSVEAYYTDLSTGYYDREYDIWWGEERKNETKDYCANTLIYADFEIEENKIDGSFTEITQFDIRSINEV